MLRIFAVVADRIGTFLRVVGDRRKQHAILAGLMDEDDYRLNDIGLTRHDIALMLGQRGSGSTVVGRPVHALRSASARQ